MKKAFIFLALLAKPLLAFCQAPAPDHLVIILEENRDYTDIVGNVSQAPYINSLLADTNAAVFSSAYGLVSGSQPNYLMLFSGSNQGVSGSTITSVQFTTCNLGAELLSAGHTFTGYAEDLPAVGDLSTTSGNYARKHNPWSNWQGTGTNQLPPATNVPFSFFPANYDSLPTVAFVVPNLVDDMHTPSDTSSIRPGDAWFRNKLGGYITWAKTHNSLLLFAFDESSSSTVQHILVFLIGQGVKGGYYTEHVDWYRLLRTIEDMYSLPYCANASTAASITDIWTATAGVQAVDFPSADLKIFPLPARDELNIAFTSATGGQCEMSLTDQLGRLIKKQPLAISAGANTLKVDVGRLGAGIYIAKVNGGGINAVARVVIEK